MVPQCQEPLVPLMFATPPASRPGSWLKTSVFGDGSLGAPRHRGTGLWSVRGPPVSGPLTPIPGSGGQVRAPCAIAGLGTDDFEPRVAMTLPRDPELGRRQTASNSRGNSTSWVLPGNRSIKAIVSVLAG